MASHSRQFLQFPFYHYTKGLLFSKMFSHIPCQSINLLPVLLFNLLDRREQSSGKASSLHLRPCGKPHS